MLFTSFYCLLKSMLEHKLSGTPLALDRGTFENAKMELSFCHNEYLTKLFPAVLLGKDQGSTSVRQGRMHY